MNIDPGSIYRSNASFSGMLIIHTTIIDDETGIELKQIEAVHTNTPANQTVGAYNARQFVYNLSENDVPPNSGRVRLKPMVSIMPFIL